jgi:hypothetical protein
MYKIYKTLTGQNAVMTVSVEPQISFIFAPDNTDYQQFKKDIQNGVVLNDAEGNPITGSDLTTFIGTLP